MTPEDLGAMEQHLLQLEEQLLQPSTRRNPESVAALLADEFCELGSSGRVFNKEETLTALANEVPANWSILDFRLRTVAAELALVTYRAQRRDQSGTPTSSSLRSSLWTWRDNRWQMLFHQGTPTTGT